MNLYHEERNFLLYVAESGTSSRQTPGSINRSDYAAVYTPPSSNEVGPKKLDHELRCIMEQITKHVEGQFNGQGTEATHSRITNDPNTSSIFSDPTIPPATTSTCPASQPPFAITSRYRCVIVSPAPNSYTSSNMKANLAQVYGLWRKEWLLRHEGVLLV